MAPTATVEPPAKRPRLETVDLKLKSGDILEGGPYLSESMEAVAFQASLFPKKRCCRQFFLTFWRRSAFCVADNRAILASER